MIQLTESVFAVVVSEGYVKFKISGTNHLCGAPIKFPSLWKVLTSKLGAGRFKILGTLTHESIDFDVEPYVKLDETEIVMPSFYQYEKRKNDAFRSLIQSKSITYEKLVIVERIGE